MRKIEGFEDLWRRQANRRLDQKQWSVQGEWWVHGIHNLSPAVEFCLVIQVGLVDCVCRVGNASILGAATTSCSRMQGGLRADVQNKPLGHACQCSRQPPPRRRWRYQTQSRQTRRAGQHCWLDAPSAHWLPTRQWLHCRCRLPGQPLRPIALLSAHVKSKYCQHQAIHAFNFHNLIA